MPITITCNARSTVETPESTVVHLVFQVQTDKVRAAPFTVTLSAEEAAGFVPGASYTLALLEPKTSPESPAALHPASPASE